MVVWMMALALAGPLERAERLADKADAERGLRPERSVRLSERALRLDPDNSLALYIHGASLLTLAVDAEPEAAQAMRETATRDLMHLIELGEDPSRIAVARQMLVIEEGTPQIALPQPDCPPEAVTAFEAAEVAFRRSDFEGAQSFYRAALDACPDNSVWWTYAGDAWMRTDADMAMLHYDRALEAEPCNWQALRFRADMHFRLGNGGPAYDDLLRSVSCNPTYAVSWEMLAGFMLDIGGQAPVPQAPRVPSTGSAARAMGDGWTAWFDARQDSTGSPLEASMRAARAGIVASGGSVQPWSVLRDADLNGHLDVAVVYLTFEESLYSELVALREREDRYPVRFLASYLFTLPQAPE